MDKQKQIEEMAKTLCANCRKDGYSCSLYSSDDDWVCAQERERAEFFYNAGYRKIPENAVVLTKEEFEKYEHRQNQINVLLLNNELLRKTLAEVRKETAEKFAAMLQSEFREEDFYCDYVAWKIDEILKEITEGTV